jgi:hypothetical protein
MHAEIAMYLAVDDLSATTHRANFSDDEIEQVW